MIGYTLQPGDTLSGLAARYLGAAGRWRDLYALNQRVIGSDPNRLQVGMRLQIPTDGPTPTDATSGWGGLIDPRYPGEASTPGQLVVTCGHHHTGGWRPQPHRGLDLGISHGSARLFAPCGGFVVAADEADPAAQAAVNPRAFNGGAGRWLGLALPLEESWLVLRLLHLADIDNRFSGGGERWATQPVAAGDYLGIVGGDAGRDVGAGTSISTGGWCPGAVGTLPPSGGAGQPRRQ